MIKIVFLIAILAISLFPQVINQTINGRVINSISGEPLQNCNYIVEQSNANGSTGIAGLFTFFLSPGNYKVSFSYVGFKSNTVVFTVPFSQKELIVRMQPIDIISQEIVVNADKETSTSTVEKISYKDISSMPNIYSDPMRTIKILPGVTSNNEMTSAYNVRGGSYDENLIYLNGYEIYRPFMIRQGMEENQSLLNQDMIKGMSFYGGAFPAEFGDKMSSALEVNYKFPSSDSLKGIARIGLLNSSMAFSKIDKKVAYNFGFRYGYPSLFSSQLFTKGNYEPSYIDGQILLGYQLNDKSRLESFFLYSKNQFNLTPESWTGYFKYSIADVKAVSISYSGKRNFSFDTYLAGLTFKSKLSEKADFKIAGAFYQTKEEENINLTGTIFFVDDVYNESTPRRFLKSRYENVANRLTLNNFSLHPSIIYSSDSHTFSFGGEVRFSSMENRINENFTEKGDSSLIEAPVHTLADKTATIFQASAYAKDMLSINDNTNVNLGLRATYYGLNGQFMVSPRAGIEYKWSNKSKINFNTGLYYQPPFFYEIRDKNLDSAKSLRAQSSAHFILGYEYSPTDLKKFRFEVYYKKYSNLIPYDIDKLKLNYGTSNSLEGYAAGVDIQYEGEIVPGLNSWVGYSYLDSKERDVSVGGEYHNRLLSQTHTLKIFLQDKIIKHPNFQVHTRMLFGSGFLYHPRYIAENPNTGDRSLAIAYDKTEDFPFYMRFDMGMSNKFELKNNLTLVIVIEVLNIFDHNNVAYYSYYQITPDSTYPVRIPEIFTGRFLNINAELRF